MLHALQKALDIAMEKGSKLIFAFILSRKQALKHVFVEFFTLFQNLLDWDKLVTYYIDLES